MSVPSEIASHILAKCGRHCCICRRFRPTLLQVHHIVESSRGGTNDEDNLIALCITCHSDVHTLRPFTQRFTIEELKAHRNAVFHLIANGILVPDENDLPPVLDVVRQQSQQISSVSISSVAAEILVAASQDDAGQIIASDYCGGSDIHTGPLNKQLGWGRERAKYRSAMNELQRAGYVKLISADAGGLWEVTYPGYLAADEIAAIAACAYEST